MTDLPRITVNMNDTKATPTNPALTPANHPDVRWKLTPKQVAKAFDVPLWAIDPNEPRPNWMQRTYWRLRSIRR